MNKPENLNMYEAVENEAIRESAENIINKGVLWNASYLMGFIMKNDVTGSLEIYNDEDEEYPDEFKEILQWWLVDKWVYEKLEEICECVAFHEETDTYFWGRTTCGQSIIQDGVFQKIVSKK